jgi:hypothetical protein
MERVRNKERMCECIGMYVCLNRDGILKNFKNLEKSI